MTRAGGLDGEWADRIRSDGHALPVRHHEVGGRLAAIAERAGGRMQIIPYGRSIEGRLLWRTIVSSACNLEGHDAGPPSGVARIWMGYGIHGSELSPSDAALRLIEWLALTEGGEADAIRDALIIHIDVMANPDGRERSLAHLESHFGLLGNPDVQSAHNDVPWPKGRGNHYLFDLNRDALFCVQPESRQRIEAIRAAAPHLYLDAHEMAFDDSFLFACPAEPFNPALPTQTHDSWHDLRPVIGAALDDAGIAHYTGSWNEVFFPGFFDIWPAYIGAVPILLEQATTFGHRVALPNGKYRDYAEAVDAQFQASRALIEAAAREPAKYIARSSEARRERPPLRFWVVDETGAKRDHIAELLTTQGIAFDYLQGEADVAGLHDHWGAGPSDVRLKTGALLVSTDQPLGALVRNLFDFHMPMTEAFLKAERDRLDEGRKTQLYDCTAWALSFAFDARVLWAAARPAGRWSQTRPPTDVAAPLPADGGKSRFGYRFDDPLLEKSPRLMVSGLKLRLATEGAGKSFLIRAEDQDAGALPHLHALAGDPGFEPLGRALADGAADPGGDAFHLLRTPSIAMLIGNGVDAPAAGALWHLFERLGVPVTLLDLATIGTRDLRRYDVLLAPHGEADVATLLDRRWIENGGTLVTMAGATRSLARSGLFSFTMDEPGNPAVAAGHGLAVGTAARPFLPPDYPPHREGAPATRSTRYLPRGCYVRADVRTGHWLTHGLDDRVPVLFREDGILHAAEGAEVLMRFAAADTLPLSGMIWPEAVATIASTPCLVRERCGRGQVIGFAWDPVFRGYSLGTQRLLLNAAVLGPAFADRP
ncbi:MAG: hypothetical protein J0H88_02385 [Sphingomonadales bacterium]|nr:hypothetical protein [Sphingomonadales bacterium]